MMAHYKHCKSPKVNTEKFRWTRDDFTLREFLDNYRFSLPVFIKVLVGYCDGDDKFTFSAQEVMRISQINTQKRVIAKDDTGKLLSIPAEYPIRFFVSEKKSGQLSAPLYLEQLLVSKHYKSGLLIVPEDKARLTFWIGTDTSKKRNMGVLEIVDTYEDQYLVGNMIANGEIYEIGTFIPMFVQLRLSVALGLERGTSAEFDTVAELCDQFCSTMEFNSIKGNPEIMLFEKDHVSDSSDYMYIEPTTYMSCTQAMEFHDGNVTNPKDVNVKSDEKDKNNSDKRGKQPKIKSKLITELKNIKAKKDKQNQSHTTVQPDEKDTYMLLDPDNIKGETADEYEPVLFRRPEPLPQTPSPRHADFQSPLQAAVTPEQASRHPPPPVPQRVRNHSQSSAHSIPPPVAPKPKPKPQIKSTPNTLYGSQPLEEIYYNTFIYKTIDEVPESLSDLSVRHIADCLRFIHLEKHVDKFIENDIDGFLLQTLDKEILMSDLGLNSFEANKLIMFRDGWRPQK